MRRPSMLFHLAALLACVAAMTAQGAPASANQAAVVKLAEGDARIASPGAEPRKAKAGDVVNEGDLLVTGKDGEIHLTMVDSGFMVLRPNTRFQVVNYTADGGDQDRGVFRLLVGGVRSITGWIGKFNSRGYQIQTPSATIGIRGTDHETRYIPEGSSEGEPGTYDRVYAGETYIETEAGRTEIAKDQSGYLSARSRERPRRLAAIPGFFRPGPHEEEISKKHAEIQQGINQRREERRKVIAEKRAALEGARSKLKEMHELNKAELEKGKTTGDAQHREAFVRIEALVKDVKANRELRDDILKTRKALEADAKAGAPRAELRERRRVLAEKERAFKQAQEDIGGRRKELVESAEARGDEEVKAALERLKAGYEQLLETRDKRKDFEQERESAREEIKGLQQQEGKRYRGELKADRKGTSPDSPK